jgi:hypothetical protein
VRYRPSIAIQYPKRSPRSQRQREANVATKDCGPTHQAQPRKCRNLGLAPVVPVTRMIPPSTPIKYPQTISSITATQGSQCSDKRLQPTHQAQPRKRRNLGLAPVVPLARTIPLKKSDPIPQKIPSIAAIMSADVVVRATRTTCNISRSDTLSLRLKQTLPFDKRYHLTPMYRKAHRLKTIVSVWQSLWIRLH